jgi:hypothetical protein
LREHRVIRKIFETMSEEAREILGEKKNYIIGMKRTDFWVAMPRSSKKVPSFGETHCLHLQGQKVTHEKTRKTGVPYLHVVPFPKLGDIT